MWRTILLATCLIVVASSEENVHSRNYTLCEAAACKQLGTTISEQLYNTDQICSNFYAFVCGGWHMKNPIPRGKLWRDQFSVAEEKTLSFVKDVLESEDQADDIPLLKAARQYHRACTDEAAIKATNVTSLKSVLQEVGGWPLLKPLETYSSAQSWRDIDKHFSKLRGSPIFYSFNTVVQNGHYTLMLDMPKFLVPHKLLVTRNHGLLNFYRDIITQTVLRLSTEEPTELFKAMISKKISDLLDFEVELARLIVTSNKIQKYVTTIGKFQKFYQGKLDLMVRANTEYLGSCLLLLSRRLVPKSYAGVLEHECKHEIDWLKEMRSVVGIENSELIHRHTPLLVNNVEYYSRLCRLLEKTPDEVIINYIHWNFLRSVLQFTDVETRNVLLKASKSLPKGIYSEHPERWQQCLRENKMAESVYRETLKKYFSDDISEKGLDIYNAVDVEARTGFFKPYIFGGYMKSLGIEAHSKKQLRYKAPKILMDPDRISKAALENNIPPTYLEQALSHQRYEARSKVWKTLEKVDYDREVNPWAGKVTSQIYEIKENKTFIDIPAASLQLPFFNVDLPDSYLFGSLGSQVGQMSSEIINLLVHRVMSFPSLPMGSHIKCYKDQKYRDYKKEERWVLIRGPLESLQQTSKEEWTHKIQDALGLEIAYNAYQKSMGTRGKEDVRLPGLEKYNSNQLFFMGFANTYCESPMTEQSSAHAPWYDTRQYSNEALVNMAVMNNKKFGSVFGCKTGTKMNPAHKCDYWKDIPMESSLDKQYTEGQTMRH